MPTSPIFPTSLPQIDTLRPLVAGRQANLEQQNLNLRARQLAQNDEQFAARFGLQRDQAETQKEQFGQQFGLDETTRLGNLAVNRQNAATHASATAGLNRSREEQHAGKMFLMASQLAEGGQTDVANNMLKGMKDSGQLRLMGLEGHIGKFSKVQGAKAGALVDLADGSQVLVDKTTGGMTRVLPPGSLKTAKPTKGEAEGAIYKKVAENGAGSLSKGEAAIFARDAKADPLLASMLAIYSDRFDVSSKSQEEVAADIKAMVRNAKEVRRQAMEQKPAPAAGGGAGGAAGAGQEVTRAEIQAWVDAGVLGSFPSDEQIDAMGWKLVSE